MAYAKIQTNQAGGGSGGNLSLAFTSNITAGSLLIAMARGNVNAAITFSDNNGNTWSTVATFWDSTDSIPLAIGYAPNANAGATTVTTTCSGSTQQALLLGEFSGGNTFAPLDQSTPGQYTASTTTPTDSTMTPSANGELVVSVDYPSGTFSNPGSGFTSLTNTFNIYGEYQIQTTATAVGPSFVNNVAAQTAIMSATFYAAGTGPTGALPSPTVVQPGATWRRHFKHRQIQLPPQAASNIALGDDPAAAADAITVAAAVPLADTGAGSDAVTVSAAVPLTDTGSGSDALTVAAAVPLTDAGSAADALTVTVAVPLTDTGSAADAVSVTAAVPLTDSGSAADSISVATGSNPSLPDTAAAADAVTIAAAVPLADTGSAADVLTVTVTVPLADAATGLDALAVSGSGLPQPPFTVTASDRAAVGVTSTSSTATVTGASTPAVNVTSTSKP